MSDGKRSKPKSGLERAHEAASSLRLKHLEQAAAPRTVKIHGIGKVKI